MKPSTLLVIAVTLLVAMSAPGVPGAQTPQVTPPADPKADVPQSDLDELMKLLDCECECECCERIKKHLRAQVKKRLKDPNARPMLAPRARVRAETRKHSKWPHEYGRRVMKQKKSHSERARKRWARELELTDEQREKIRELRHQQHLDVIDLRAELEKQELELKHMMRGAEVRERDLRQRVDSIAKFRADIQFRKLKVRLAIRELLDDEQREKLRRGRR